MNIIKNIERKKSVFHKNKKKFSAKNKKAIL